MVNNYSSEYDRILFQELPIGLALCRMDGTLVDINKAYADIIGYTIEETLKLTYWQITPQKYLKEEEEQVRKLSTVGKYGPYEKEYIHKSGRLIPVRLNGMVIEMNNEKYIWSSVENIAELKSAQNMIVKAKERLEASEKTLKEAQSIAHIGNWELDLTNNNLRWSDEIYRIFGCVPDEFEASYEGFLRYIHKDDQNMVDVAYRKHLQEKIPYNIVHRIVQKDGTVKYVNERCSTNYDGNGKPLRSLGTVADITEQVKSQIDLIEAKEKAEKANRAKSEFLSNMSHEIRTPINGIMGFTDVLLDMETDPEKLEMLSLIKESNEHLLEIINDILSISKIEAGKYQIHAEKVNIYEKLKSILAVYSKQSIKSEVEFTVEIDESINKKICIDYISLNKILNNLISNAIKFTNRGYIKVKIEEKSGDKLEISVEDTGIGISNDKQRKLYEPFEQGEHFLTKQYGGTGLGLAIVKQLVDLMQGEIKVETELKKGTKFTVTVPFVSCGTKENDCKINVISAEDVEINQKLLEKILDTNLFNMTKVSNGKELLYELEKQKYDLILMDIQMPVINGIEATKIIRQNGPQKDIPIIAVTAYAFDENIENVLGAGVDDYIAKPINKKELMEKINRYRLKNR